MVSRHSIRLLTAVLLVCLALTVFVSARIGESETEPEYMVWLKPAGNTRRSAPVSGSAFLVVDEAELNRLLDEGTVARYEEDQIVELLDGGSWEDQAATGQWDLDVIHAAVPYTYGYAGAGVKIAVIDSGCADHPDLRDALLPGYNYADDSVNTTDTYGHGTSVCGFLAAAGHGVAPEAKLVPLKCFEGGTTKLSRIVRAVYDAVDVYGCQIVNLSLGLKPKSYPTSLEEAVDHARDLGVVVVSAVGNEGNADLYYPAAFPSVLGVGSVTSDKELSYLSQRNESVFLTAPGHGVPAATMAGGYATVTPGGTSYATPHVSGIVAILLSYDSSLTPDQIETLLRENAEDLGVEGYDTSFGYGLVDGAACLDALLDGQDYFLSPVDDGSVRVFNRTDRDLTGSLVVTRRQNGLMTSCDLVPVSVSAGDYVTATLPAGTGEAKCFLWRGISDSAVLTGYRDGSEPLWRPGSGGEFSFDAGIADGETGLVTVTVRPTLPLGTSQVSLLLTMTDPATPRTPVLFADQRAAGNELSFSVERNALAAAFGTDPAGETVYLTVGIDGETVTAPLRYGTARGDVDDDGQIGPKDVTTLRRYLVGGYGVTVCETAADVDQDGVIGPKDVTFLRRALVGGYDATLD